MKVDTILVPYDSGQPRKRMGLGPEEIFHSGLKQLLTDRGVEVASKEIVLESPYPAEISAAFELCRKVAAEVRQSREAGRFPIVLSGNCNTSVGTISGCGPERTGIIWFDAHGEANTPDTTMSGFLDGMPIATLLGRAWRNLAKTIPGFEPIPGNRIVLFGSRDVEPAERELLNSCGVSQISAVDRLRSELPSIAKQVMGIYLHADLDVLDSSVATANQWASAGGITLECLLEAIHVVRHSAPISALGIASYDPGVDRDGRALNAALRVVEAALEST